MISEKDITISQEEQIVVFRKILRQLARQMFERTGFDEEYIDIVVKCNDCKEKLTAKLDDESKALFDEYNHLIRERQRYLAPTVYELFDMYDYKYVNVEKFSISLD